MEYIKEEEIYNFAEMLNWGLPSDIDIDDAAKCQFELKYFAPLSLRRYQTHKLFNTKVYAFQKIEFLLRKNKFYLKSSRARSWVMSL